MTDSHISGAEEFARGLLRSAEAKRNAIDRAAGSEGLIDDSATVIELVLKHRLACDFMEKSDTRERRAIECEIKNLGHKAKDVFDKLTPSTQQEIQSIYCKCQRGHDDYFASKNRRMADFEEMLAWVTCGPGYRYTTALTEPHVPIGRCWNPVVDTSEEELPSFPDALVEWATKKWENAKPRRSLRETIEAEYDLLSGLTSAA